MDRIGQELLLMQGYSNQEALAAAVGVGVAGSSRRDHPWRPHESLAVNSSAENPIEKSEWFVPEFNIPSPPLEFYPFLRQMTSCA